MQLDIAKNELDDDAIKSLGNVFNSNLANRSKNLISIQNKKTE